MTAILSHDDLKLVVEEPVDGSDRPRRRKATLVEAASCVADLRSENRHTNHAHKPNTYHKLVTMCDANGEQVKRLVEVPSTPTDNVTLIDLPNSKIDLLIHEQDGRFRVQFVVGNVLLFEPQVRYATQDSAIRCSVRRLVRFVQTGSWFPSKKKQLEQNLRDQDELYLSFLPPQDGDTSTME